MKTFNDYETEAAKTTPAVTGPVEGLLLGALGLSGETAEALELVLSMSRMQVAAGKVAETVKKFVFHGHALDTSKLARELGDCLWYINHTANAIGYGLGDIAQIGVDKLRARYGEKFSEDASRNRKADDV